METVLTPNPFVGKLESPIELTAVTTGGEPPYTYTYTVYLNGSLLLASEPTQEAFYAFTPTVVGNYGFVASVTDSEGQTQMVATQRVTVTYAGSRLEDIYLYLQSKGVNVYLPAHHMGEANRRFVVVRPSLGARVEGYSTFYQSYQLLMYVPRGEGSQIENYVEEIREIMKPLAKQLMIKETYFRANPYYEDSVKAYMVDLEYRVYRKITL